MASGIDNATGQQYGSFYATGLTGNPAFDWFIRNTYLEGVVDARNNEFPMLGKFYKNKIPAGGKFVTKAIKDGRNWGGVSAIHEEGNMPDPVYQRGYLYTVPLRSVYARIKLTGALLRAAKNGGSLLDPMELEWSGVHSDVGAKQEIMMHSDGSGRRAEFASAAGTFITVRLNQDNEGVSTCTTAPTIYLGVGMRVCFISAAGTIRNSVAYYVASIQSTTTITVSATLGGGAVDLSLVLVAGDWVCDASRVDLTASALTNKDAAFKAEPMGLEGVMRDVGVLDGNAISTAGQQTGAQDYTQTSITAAAVGFQGLPVNSTFATYTVPTWNRAVVADGGGAVRNISDSLLQRAYSDSWRINNAQVKMLFSNTLIYDSYFDSLVGDKRFNSTTIAGGHAGDGQVGGITFNGLEWFKSRYMLDNRIMGLDPEVFNILENTPLSVVAPPGNPMWERLHDTDAYFCAIMTEYQLFVNSTRDRTGFHLTDIQ